MKLEEVDASGEVAHGGQVKAGRTVNVFCLCGAVIGIAAAFCGWFLVSAGDFESSEPLLEGLMARLDPRVDLWPWFVGGLAFIAGAALALFTPLAGLLQAFGLGATFLHIVDQRSILRMNALGWDFGPGLGVYLGVVSTALVLSSILLPMGPGFGNGAPSIRSRLLVFAGLGERPVRVKRWSLARERSKPLAQHIVEGLRAFASSLGRPSRKWVALLVAVMVWSVTVVALGSDVLEDDPLLTQVSGGLVIDVNTFVGFWYEGHHISITDGASGAGWSFPDTLLDGGAWCAVDLGCARLGSLDISLTLIERSGDGFFGPGDSMVLTTQNESHYADGVVYSIWLKTNRVLSWSGMEVSFVFHDGEIESWVSKDWFAGL